MSILRLCTTQIDECNFNIKNITPQQTYDDLGIDLTDGSVTAATLSFRKYNDTVANTVTIDILADWAYVFQCTGLNINITDFPELTFMGYDYFPDWMYQTIITYTYNGTEYTDTVQKGFLKRIYSVVEQQMMQANWKKELACTCGCESYTTTLRKWNYLQMLGIAENLCLINEFQTILLSLYKITGTIHEYN